MDSLDTRFSRNVFEAVQKTRSTCFIVDRRSQTVADDRKKGCFHIIATIAEPTAGIRFGQRKRQKKNNITNLL